MPKEIEVTQEVINRWMGDTECWTKGDYVVEEKEAERLEGVGRSYRSVESISRVCMRPDEFLFLTNFPLLSKESFENIKNRLREGKPIDPLFLDIDKDMTISNHEGRHRAMAAICESVEKVPVILFMKGED